MERELLRPIITGIIVFNLIIASVSCEKVRDSQQNVSVPAGYYSTLEISMGSRLYRFGPFVGYYFRPQDPADLSKLDFLCFNEQRFYTHDLPVNTLLFRGNALLALLPDTEFKEPVGSAGIVPIFEESIPGQWIATRPEPQEEYRHFHSLHDDQGAAMSGYWLRHVGEANFTYDMGGRVEPDSPLYHKVMPGVDWQFPFIVEFDNGRQQTINKKKYE